MNQTLRFQKAFVAARYYLSGAKMHMALAALEFAAPFHAGFRKDGVTPAFLHQLRIFQYARTLSGHLTYPEETFATIMLHDTPEDSSVGHVEIEQRFGCRVGTSVKFLTKTHRGQKLNTDTYYNGVASDEIASAVKGPDRIDNLGSMVGVFSTTKQREYVEETTKYVLPMLKTARRTFTKQEPAYENMKFVLNTQLEFVEALLTAGGVT